MREAVKTKKELIRELEETHQQLANLEAIEAKGEAAAERADHLTLTLRAIRNVNQLIAREKDQDRLLKGICQSLVGARGYYNAWIALLDEAGKLVACAEAGFGREFVPIVEQLKLGRLTRCGRQALQQPEVLVVEDPASTCADCPLSHMYAGRAGLSVRLEYEGKVYGLLCASMPYVFATAEETNLFKEVVEDIAIALHTMELEDERKRAEEALRESEEKYRTLVEDALIGIMNVDMTGKITYVNKTILQATGYSWEDLVGKNTFKLGLTSSETEKVLIKRMKEKLTGQPPGLLEIQYKRKDGEWIWLQIRGRVLKKHNIPVGIQIIGEEITEQKRAEEALRESEEKFSKAFRASPETVTITTLEDGKYVEVNDTFSRISGYTREEVIGHSVADLGTWAHEEERDRIIQRLKEKGKVRNEEVELRTK